MIIIGIVIYIALAFWISGLIEDITYDVSIATFVFILMLIVPLAWFLG